MTFVWPVLLWLLLLVPVLVLLYLWLMHRRKKNTLQFSSLSIVKQALGKGPGWRRHVPPALLLMALTTLLLASARPAAVLTLPMQEETIILAMDVSGSMRATDVKPNRLEAAQVAARAFVGEQPKTTRIGIVSLMGSSTRHYSRSRIAGGSKTL